MLTTNQTSQGAITAVAANFLYSLLFLFGLLLQPLSGTQVASWRVLTMFFGLVLLVGVLKQWQHIFDYLKTLKNAKEWFLFILPTPILGAQIWMFMWAPVNGLGLEVTLGYFLYPMIMIVVGRFLYNEDMSLLQWAAIICAGLGIAYDIFEYGAISWATLFVCLGYPPRRRLKNRHIKGVLIAHRFRQIKKYQQKIDKMTRKIEALHVE
ncbi:MULTISPECIES: hypothetical protein [Psychrobacter]|jgi:chloramphenicol-sensitive protein RarD|uniref:EamA domain-containing protein n=1 Tax=Psychrobacter pocilloporae TaxID=1775882 RepID=A0ABT6IRA9_9GAMM|nr:MULTISPECIES: hypothetical protein [Psychrobacter]MDH4904365.1 hypothetical protein [Psychrobacter pocilloporae]